jgi:hypothetical protein
MSVATWVAAGVAFATGAGPGAPPAGDAAGYVFASAPVNALGVRGMADLRGKPVLIDFWGTR